MEPFFKIMSWLLTYHWPRQVTWLRAKARDTENLPLAVVEAVEGVKSFEYTTVSAVPYWLLVGCNYLRSGVD
jgi:hypothetical protein